MAVVERCRILTDYEKKTDNELNLKIGNIVELIRRGQYTWYGIFNGEKGFFPSKIAEIIEETLTEKLENSQQSTQIDKDSLNETTVALDTSPTTTEDSDCSNCTSFNEITSAPPLEDKRRSRARSAGRPPSQLFIKETILRCNSRDDCVTSEEEDITEVYEEKSEDPRGTTTKITSISQLVYKMKPELKSAIPQVLPKEHSNSDNNGSETSDNKPEWMKALPRRKLSGVTQPPVPKTDQVDKTPPWMKEIKKRKEHKLSLRGDELAPKMETETETVQKSTAVFNETKTETQISVGVVAEEKRTLQTKSTSSTTTVESNFSISSFKDNLDLNVKSFNDNIDSLMKRYRTPVETKVTSNAAPALISNSEENLDRILDKNSPTEHNKTIKVSKEPLKKSKSVDLLDFTSDKPLKGEVQEKENKVQLGKNLNEGEQKKSTTPGLTTSSNKALKDYKEKVSNTVKELMEKFEHFETKTAAHSLKIKQQIKCLEKEDEKQNEEMKTFITAMKEELLQLIKSDES